MLWYYYFLVLTLWQFITNIGIIPYRHYLSLIIHYHIMMLWHCLISHKCLKSKETYGLNWSNHPTVYKQTFRIYWNLTKITSCACIYIYNIQLLNWLLYWIYFLLHRTLCITPVLMPPPQIDIVFHQRGSGSSHESFCTKMPLVNIDAAIYCTDLRILVVVLALVL